MTRAQILRRVSLEHSVSIDDIKGPRRKSHIMVARKEAIARLKAAGFSLGIIAHTLNRDYSTITHHCYPSVRAKRIARAMRTYHERKAAA